MQLVCNTTYHIPRVADTQQNTPRCKDNRASTSIFYLNVAALRSLALFAPVRSSAADSVVWGAPTAPSTNQTHEATGCLSPPPSSLSLVLFLSLSCLLFLLYLRYHRVLLSFIVVFVVVVVVRRRVRDPVSVSPSHSEKKTWEGREQKKTASPLRDGYRTDRSADRPTG